MRYFHIENSKLRKQMTIKWSVVDRRINVTKNHQFTVKYNCKMNRFTLKLTVKLHLSVVLLAVQLTGN